MLKAASAPVRRKKQPIKRFLPLYLLTIPGFVYLIINNYLPMSGLVVAFKKFSVRKGIFGSDWIGLKNFEYLFKTSDAFVITRNTICYNLTFILINTVLAITVAILLSEMMNRKASRFYQSVILMPHLISWVIVSYLVFALLSAENGFINKTLLGGRIVSWYNEAGRWPFILVLVSAWKSVGYSCIIYLASIIGIDRGYYEAASIEGASKLAQIRYITLPLLRPLILLMVMLAVGRIFYSDFGMFYQVPLNSGAIYSTTNVIDTYVYRALLQLNNVGMSSAAGLYQAIVGFVLVLISNLLVRKLDPESALF